MITTNLVQLANEQCLMHNAIFAYQQECIWCMYIHTGVRPGNRKMSTYFKYLLRLGWNDRELALCCPSFSDEPFNPSR